jgi:hypothetical protein
VGRLKEQDVSVQVLIHLYKLNRLGFFALDVNISVSKKEMTPMLLWT